MVFDKIVELITSQLPVDAADIKMESRLLEDLKADSASVMMLVMDIENEFDVVVEDDMLTHVKTVGDIVKYLEGLAK